MKESMKLEVEALGRNLKGVYRVVFGEEYVGEVDVVALALLIRNELKDRNVVPQPLRNRFNRILKEMGCVDYRLTAAFYKQCV